MTTVEEPTGGRQWWSGLWTARKGEQGNPASSKDNKAEGIATAPVAVSQPLYHLLRLQQTEDAAPQGPAAKTATTPASAAAPACASLHPPVDSVLPLKSPTRAFLRASTGWYPLDTAWS